MHGRRTMGRAEAPILSGHLYSGRWLQVHDKVVPLCRSTEAGPVSIGLPPSPVYFKNRT